MEISIPLHSECYLYPGANDILNGQATLTLTALGSSDCGPSSDALILMIYPEVVTNAGNDQTIPYNTSTLLSGTASGGGGTFTPEWEPSALLINPTIFNPTTVNLVGSQVFTLTATSNLTGCQSSDEVTVSVSGGPLGVTATATPENICPGGTSQLSAIAGGGSGAYTYSWTSNPAGFSSTLPNPVVNPIITTVYTVELNDGFASVFGQATVTVNTIPLVPANLSGLQP
ncbi:MAG: hypothetical protein IPH45_07265 [Bacteroidales bacterium]|nr:hypothetical protein [Bacteroidales bacterium]